MLVIVLLIVIGLAVRAVGPAPLDPLGALSLPNGLVAGRETRATHTAAAAADERQPYIARRSRSFS